ncbi:MAG TPA: peptidoglycan recognition family protein [Solirubrobacterales bacterium]|nr:peptidoglycan recognition family protein [Solirubrobacterales bacterium]
MTRIVALAILVAVALTAWTAPDAPEAASIAAAKPSIRKMLIPYPKKRKRDMAAYSKRHYGGYKWRLNNPKLIVIHYAVAGSIRTIYNTFAPNQPDVEFGELPGVCSQYAVGAGGGSVKFVPPSIRCRHVVGLNHVAIGIEHVGFSDADVLNRPAQLNGSLELTQWLRCRFGIPVEGVIGHNESLSSPYYKELDPRFKGKTHGDFNRASMDTYRAELEKLGSC